MFWVWNKDKMVSYLIVTSMVIILFLLATTFSVNEMETIQTATKISRELPVYGVDTNEKKIALTINCAWNADDIDSILQTLEKMQCEVTFFMVGEWVDKYPEAVKKIQEAGHEIRKSFRYSSTCK